jgi:uncharacterized protein (DUF1697 family)
MTEYVAFLRGVNVGGRVVKMAELKSCLESTGLQNVQTIVQSGNVTLESPETSTAELKKQIAAVLEKTFGFKVRVQVLTRDALAKIVTANPFSDAGDTKHQYVIFMENGLEKDLCAEAEGLDSQQEAIKCGRGVVYWKVDKGSTLKSTFAKYLTKAKYKDFNTNRNINTLQKMLSI